MQQLEELKRRKYELNLKQARYGINTAPEISIELQDIDAVISQLELIVIHRHNLETLTKQAGHFGASVAPHVLSQIASERGDIARLKRICASKRYPVDDAPIDFDDQPAAPQATPAPMKESQLDRIERKLDRILRILGEPSAP